MMVVAARRELGGGERQHPGSTTALRGSVDHTVCGLARARGVAPMMVVAARRELGGGERQHPGSTTALRGLMASLALRSASPWTAMSKGDRPAGYATCAMDLCGSGRPPRGGRRRSFVGGDWAMPARGAEDRRRAPATRPPRSSVRPARHSPPHDDIRVVLGWWPLTAPGFARAPKSVVAPAALNDHQNLAALIILSVVSHARGAWRR